MNPEFFQNLAASGLTAGTLLAAVAFLFHRFDAANEKRIEELKNSNDKRASILEKQAADCQDDRRNLHEQVNKLWTEIAQLTSRGQFHSTSSHNHESPTK